MSYVAKVTYTNSSTSKSYDIKRFRSIKGKVGNWLEKRSMTAGVKYLMPKSKKSQLCILDAPSGTGRLSEHLLKKGFGVAAIDISLAMIRNGEEIYNLQRFNNFKGYVRCDLERLPFQDRSFDVVVCLRFMGHIPIDVKINVLKEFSRVARIGIVSMFAINNPLVRLRRWLFQLIRLKPNSLMWFPHEHSKIIAASEKSGLYYVRFNSMVRFISESRFYVFEKKEYR